MDYLTHNETETEALGARLAGALSPGAVVAYRGGLGMGKTAFTRGLARGLGYDADACFQNIRVLIQFQRTFSTAEQLFERFVKLNAYL